MTACFASDLRPPPVTPTLRDEEFCAWVGRAEPGQRLEYHRGQLVVDRSREASPLQEKHRRQLVAVADRALSLVEDARLHLLQKRHGDGDYSYLAVVATPAHRKRVVLGARAERGA